MEVQYLNEFKSAAKLFTLSGNRILVERLDTGEIKSKGGIILAESTAYKSDLKSHKPLVCMVLAVGEGYTQEDKDEKIPLDVKPGDVVVLNALGVSFFSTLPGVASYTEMRVGITSESDVQMRFASLEHFEEYTKVFNG